MKKAVVILVAVFGINSLYTESMINIKNSTIKLDAEAELGFVSVLNHTLQNGEESTNFNYREQGGQDILFPFTRYQLGLSFDQHLVKMLYQPLNIVTNVEFRDEVIMDTTTFDSGTPMEITYSFPFWRMTYLYDLLEDPTSTLAFGLSLQLRNASIIFKEIGGNNLTVSQNLGPVPALSLLYDKEFKNNTFLSFDATGSYASSSFFNGADFEFEGSLLDTSLKVGMILNNSMKWFISFRYLGGSATGNSEYVNRTWSESISSYTDNRLATFVLTTGVKLY